MGITEYMLASMSQYKEQIEKLQNQNTKMRNALEEIERFIVLTRQDIDLPMQIARECLDELESK